MRLDAADPEAGLGCRVVFTAATADENAETSWNLFVCICLLFLNKAVQLCCHSFEQDFVDLYP